MFMLTIKKSVQMSVLLGALVGSVAAHAETASISDVVGTIEQILTAQTQELFVSVKREFVMSLQTQLAESMYDFNSQLSLNAENKGESAGVDEYSAK